MVVTDVTTVFVFIAFICFVLATFGVGAKVNLVAAGLAILTGLRLFGRL